LNTALAQEALTFEQVIVDALVHSGGFEHVMRAERDPNHRLAVAEILGTLGVWDIDPAADHVQLEAAALACRAAGRFALPYPVAERLAANSIDGPGAIAPVSGVRTPRIAHADLQLGWWAVDLDDRLAPVVATGPATGGKLGPFVNPVELAPWGGGAQVLPLVMALRSWTLLGMLQAALAHTCDHVRNRHQFGQPLIAFQSVSFALTDISVATQGLEELAKYTLWAVVRGLADATTDALALTALASEAAETTFRVAHQLHGATGFCDETPVSWLSRYSQALRRIPLGRSQTEHSLAQHIRQTGFYSPVARTEVHR
jgi:hypothetical protein